MTGFDGSAEHELGWSEPVDEEMAGELAALLRPGLDPPPDLVLQAKMLYPWRTVDAELAVLAADSLLDEVGGRIRAEEGVRALTFAVDAFVIEVEIDEVGRRLLGQLEPAVAAEVAVVAGRIGEEPQVGVPVRSDALGRFIVTLPKPGLMVGIRCRRPDGSVVQTALVRL